MEKKIKISIIFLSLVVIGTKAADINMQESAKGKVVLTEDQKPVAGVIITVNDGKEIRSDANGIFYYSTTDKSNKPKVVKAYKEGLEISVWEHDPEGLKIYLRDASIKTVKGTLLSRGKAVPNQLFVFKGKIDSKTITDDRGNFSFKVKYDQDVNLNSRIIANGTPLKINSIREDRVKALINLQLEVQNSQPLNHLTKVLVIDEKDLPVKGAIVTISGESYIAGDDGTFLADDITLDKKDWLVEGSQPTSIESSKNNKLITVISPRISIGNLAATSPVKETASAQLEVVQTPDVADNVIKQGIDDLIDYYNVEAGDIQKKNQNLTFLIDSLSNVTILDSTKREEYITQLEILTKSIGTTSDAFDELKANSTELISIMRSLLLQKEEKIREIELEKQRQAEQFKNNLLFVLSILGIASLLVVILIFIARRISARKKVIERVKNQLAEAQNIAKIGSMTYFLKNKQHEYSDHFFSILGIKDETRIKKMHRITNQYVNSELLKKDEVGRVNEAFEKSLEKDESLSMEIKVLSDKKEELFVDLRSKIERNSSGKPEAIYSTLQDVTEKKERELQLIEAKTEAEKANQEKEDFLSTMSHEIRTPLNGIVGLTDHLIGSQPPEHLVENIKTLKFSADHLLSLVNDVLDFNKIQAGKMVLAKEPFNLKEHMNNAVKAITLIALHKDIEVSLHIDDKVPALVKGDKVRLNQVISNLLNNAIKFTEKGTIKLTLHVYKTIGRKVYIYFSVKDSGIGIESSKLDKIFQSFEQEDVTTSNKYGGTGLGLAISRQLVKLFGGELSVTSQQGVGSEFYFAIPLDKVNPKEVEKHQNNTTQMTIADFSKLNILCVEDNEVNQLVISQYFENWKMNYAFAATGEEALEKFRKEPYDLVFMDINLPDQKGYDVVVKMREEFPDSPCAFVALTADTGDNLKGKMMKSGMSGLLSKPFSNEELKSIIYRFGNKKIRA